LYRYKESIALYTQQQQHPRLTTYCSSLLPRYEESFPRALLSLSWGLADIIGGVRACTLESGIRLEKYGALDDTRQLRPSHGTPLLTFVSTGDLTANDGLVLVTQQQQHPRLTTYCSSLLPRYEESFPRALLSLSLCATVLLAGLLVLRLPQGNDCIGIKRVSRFIVCTISSDNSSCLLLNHRAAKPAATCYSASRLVALPFVSKPDLLENSIQPEQSRCRRQVLGWFSLGRSERVS
jgi:hypothetical protein